jgi:hypothetical protein
MTAHVDIKMITYLIKPFSFETENFFSAVTNDLSLYRKKQLVQVFKKIQHADKKAYILLKFESICKLKEKYLPR